MALKDLQTGSRRIFQVESICCTLLRAHCRDGQSWSKQSCRHGVAATSNGTTNNGLLGIGIVETKKKRKSPVAWYSLIAYKKQTPQGRLPNSQAP